MANFEKNIYNEFDELAEESYDEDLNDLDSDEYDEYADEYFDDEFGDEDADEGDEETLSEEDDEQAVEEEEMTSEEDGDDEFYDDDFTEEKDEGPKWYVVHTYSGHENKVKVNLEKIVANRNMQDLVSEIMIPTETVIDEKGKARERKLFPGYVLVKMIITNESWYLVRNTQGVTGFVGHGSDPIPLTDEEAERMGIEKKAVILIDIEKDEAVRITDGVFKSYTGIVKEINAEKQILTVLISGFGGETPVELKFDQVEKID